MTERESRYGKVIWETSRADEGTISATGANIVARAVIAVADDELAAVTKDRDIYKDAFKDATMANTVSARKLAEQEAKTVEYRAAWIKATRERDHHQKMLRQTRAGLRELTEGLCECGDESCQESAWRIALGAVMG